MVSIAQVGRDVNVGKWDDIIETFGRGMPRPYIRFGGVRLTQVGGNSMMDSQVGRAVAVWIYLHRGKSAL